MDKPKIRFKGYTDAWEQRKLGDVCHINGRIGFRGYTQKDIISKEDGGILTFSPANIVDNRLTLDVRNTYITKTKFDESPEIKISNGDILFVKTGSTLGKSALVSELFEPASINPQIVVLRTEKSLREIIAVLLTTNSIQQQVGAVKIGGAVPTMTESKLKEFELWLPSEYKERIAIGSFFHVLDDLITLHQRKCDETKTVKKYMLQKMFPKNGKNAPEIRFAGFTDAWKQRKFSDLAQRESAVEKSSSDCPSVEYEDVIAEEGRLNKDIKAKETQKTGIKFDGTQVLYGKLRPYLHNWLNPDFMGVAVGDWWVLKPLCIDKNYLYRLIQTKQFDDVANQSAGSKMPRADWNLISNTEFFVPASIEEQSKIAKVFTNLDSLITLHQRKFDELKKIKKFMLQNMFV